MTTDFGKLWEEVRSAVSEVEAIRALVQLLSSKDGRNFVSGLELSDGVLCIEIPDHVRSYLPSAVHHARSPMPIQALAGHNLLPFEKQVIYVTLRRLAGIHGRLPDSMVIREQIRTLDSGQSNRSGGFADIKQAEYKGQLIAVKTMKVAGSDNFEKIRRVSGENAFVIRG